MTGRQRILAALDHRIPDRVPVWIHGINEISIINIGRHFFEELPEPKPLVRMSPEEQATLVKAAFRLHQVLEIDGITTLENDAGTMIDETRFRNSWGCVMRINPYGLPFLDEPPIGARSDLQGYVPPQPTEQLLALLTASVQMAGDQMARFFIIRGVFVRSHRLRGMEGLLSDMALDPELVEDLARIVTEYNLSLIQAACDLGADVIVIDDDAADKNSTLMSPEYYRRFIRPWNEKLVAAIHRRNARAVFHSDGNIWSIMDDLVEMGFDGVNPLEPDAGMDLGVVKSRYGKRFCLLGNIDCGELLCNGSVDEVEEAVREAIEAASPDGGYILCSSNSIHPGVKPENFIAMVQAAKTHGVY